MTIQEARSILHKHFWDTSFVSNAPIVEGEVDHILMWFLEIYEHTRV